MSMPIRVKVAAAGRHLVLAGAPKTGSTSFLHWLWEIQEGRPYDGGGSIHDAIYDWRVPVGHRAKGDLKVAVHRDGVRRMISVYNHWICQRGGPEGHALKALCPDVDAFALRFPLAINRDQIMRHHCRLQSFSLGADAGEYDITHPSDELSDLPGVVEAALGIPPGTLPVMRRANSRVYDIPLTAEAERRLRAYVALDDLVGWDGKTRRSP